MVAVPVSVPPAVMVNVPVPAARFTPFNDVVSGTLMALVPVPVERVMVPLLVIEPLAPLLVPRLLPSPCRSMVPSAALVNVAAPVNVNPKSDTVMVPWLVIGRDKIPPVMATGVFAATVTVPAPAIVPADHV